MSLFINTQDKDKFIRNRFNRVGGFYIWQQMLNITVWDF